jgi:hypothetical protein
MRASWWALAAVLLPALCCPAEPPGGPAPDAAGPVVVVDFSDSALSIPHWTLTLYPGGNGHFRSETNPAPAGAASDEVGTPSVDRDIRLSAKFTASVFEVAQRHNWFNEPCESHLKVAFQGWKELTYNGPQGRGSCTFNYSKDKEIQTLGDSFTAVAETILAGVRLEMLLQHDPLGLDKEIESLADAERLGRAQQLCVIRGILERLAGDDNVMELVRKRARLLLARADS